MKGARDIVKAAFPLYDLVLSDFFFAPIISNVSGGKKFDLVANSGSIRVLAI